MGKKISYEEYRIDGIGFRVIAYDVFVFGEPASYGMSLGMNFLRSKISVKFAPGGFLPGVFCALLRVLQKYHNRETAVFFPIFKLFFFERYSLII